jgi:CCR4-NOT transcription complex subunit 7/8
LTGAALPTTEDLFFHLLKVWFPRAFDVKSICRAFDSQLKGGLAEVAEDLGVRLRFHI